MTRFGYVNQRVCNPIAYTLVIIPTTLVFFGCAPITLDSSPPTAVASTASVSPPEPPSVPAQLAVPAMPGPPTRPFFMGFTLWPADLSEEGLQIAQDFARLHGDIVSIPFISGIPWTEALDGKPFSKDVQGSMSYRPPAGKKLFLSVSPLDRDRRALAPYWGDRDNQPLPKPWDAEPLNSPRVKKAYLNFLLRAVERMRPDYLAIAVEPNVLLAREPSKWRQFKELYRDTYTALKKAHPSLQVFFTTAVLHYKRLTNDSKGTDQEREVAELMKQSDLFAMSVYPYTSREVPRPIPSNFFDFASRFKKPIAVSESGMSSRNVLLRSYGVILNGSEANQQHFTELLLNAANRDEYEFVINFATTDSEKLASRLPPPADDLARIWAFTGMQTSDKKPKPALAVWEAYLRAKLVRVW